MRQFHCVLIFLFITVVSAWSPTNGYAPGNVSCPKGSLVRVAGGHISQNESSYIKDRLQNTRQPLIDWLESRANFTSDFNPSQFLSNTSINIGLAFSGGGYRAMLSGAGMFSALDNRTINSTESNMMGGLVQAATYLTGLSGGNWLVNSIVLNNFTSIQDLQGSSEVWDLEHSIFNPGGANIFKSGKYWDELVDAVKAKQKAGFNTSLTDLWGRALSYQFINLTEGGPALSFSDVRNYDKFVSREMPFPIVVSDGRAPNTLVVSLNSTVFEFNPFEMGSYDPTLNAFTDVKYLGTSVNNGKPNTSECVAGFDNAGFVLGTSSTLFNQFLLQLNSTGVEGVVYDLARDILTDLGNDYDDIAVYDPNPFAGVKTVNNSLQHAKWLDLVDGGEDNQNIPLLPLIQPARKVDVAFAFDNSADTTFNWPNGSSLVSTFERQFGAQANDTIFPYVPDTNTFINEGLTKRPTFFGCYRDNLTTLFNSSQPESDHFYPPLIVYISNYAHSFFANTSTFKMEYSQKELAGMIENGYNVVTQLNGTIDTDWPTCVGCAIVQRERERRGLEPTDQCKQCFDTYCWAGKVDDSAVNMTSGSNFAPTLDTKSNSSAGRVASSLALVAALGFASTLLV